MTPYPLLCWIETKLRSFPCRESPEKTTFAENGPGPHPVGTRQQMIAATRRALLSVTILVVGLTAAVQADLLRYRTAIRSLAEGQANFRTVEALPARDATNPARAFAGGSFTGRFRIGFDPTITVSSLNEQDGNLVGFTRSLDNKDWNVDWVLSVGCEPGNAVINDVAIRPDGLLLAGGTFEDKATFDRRQQPPVELTTPGRVASFIALADPSGAWIDARIIPGMELQSMAVDDEGEVFVTGPGTLARRYTAALQEVWDIQPPAGILSLDHIAVGIGRSQPFVYVQGTSTRPGDNDPDVFVVQLEKPAGVRRWNTIINSRGGEEHAGGIGVGPLGDLRVAVSSNGTDLSVANSVVRDNPTTPARHGYLLFLDATSGKLLNDRLLGRATEAQGILETHNLDIDYAGNTYVSASFTGSYQFIGLDQKGEEDAAVVVVDALGVPMRFMDSSGEARASGLDVAAAGRDLQVLVGAVQGTTDELFGESPVAASQDNKAYIAVLDKPDDQQSYLITPPNPDQGLGLLVQDINQLEGEIYRIIDNPQLNIRLVSAYLTPEQVNNLQQQGARVEQDRELVPPGVDGLLWEELQNGELILNIPDLPQKGLNGGGFPAGWALATLNQAPSNANAVYCYPETCRETVLYLIDTGIDTSSGVFANNPNLEISESIVIRATGDPLEPLSGYDPTIYEHGTEMLSMIAGTGYGAAQGTPIKVINYNIYPDGNTTTISALIEAIIRASTHKNLHHPYDPAAFCIASSADTPGDSPASLESAIDSTLDNVYATVLVSAGNTDGLASEYTPSDLGSKKGVICVGAIDASALPQQVENTRGGPGVDLWAPGEMVAAADVDGNPTTMTGTSASTALATGAALIYLSANPVLTPSQIESAMKGSAQEVVPNQKIVYVPDPTDASAANDLNHMGYADWASWYELDPEAGPDEDPDNDDWSNEQEYVWGFDPRSHNYEASILTMGYDPDTGTATFEFPLSCFLYQPSALASPFTLRDGSSLTIERSDDLTPGHWIDCTSEVLNLDEEGHESNVVTISFDVEATKSRCFYRIRVHQ